MNTGIMVVTGAGNTLTLHICERCRGTVEQPCKGSLDGTHSWECFSHYGHPTGEQMCHNMLGLTASEACSDLRHHPNQAHIDAHAAGHRAYLADGGECWCAT